MSEAPLVDPDAAAHDPSDRAAARHASIAPPPVPSQDAARWLARWGEQDPEATSEVTVHAAQAVALVCCGVRVGRAELNDLVEYASTEEHVRRLYLFSDIAFGTRVASMADELGVALFWWDEAGGLQPIGSLAHQRSGTVPTRAVGAELPSPSVGRRRAEPVEPPVESIADPSPAVPVAEWPGPDASTPLDQEPHQEEPARGKRRAAVATDSPSGGGAEVDVPPVPLDVDPVLVEAMAPLADWEVPAGDPLFTALATESPDQRGTDPTPDVEPAGEVSWGSWTEYEPAPDPDQTAIDEPGTQETPVVDAAAVAQHPEMSPEPAPDLAEPAPSPAVASTEPDAEVALEAVTPAPVTAPAPELTSRPVTAPSAPVRTRPEAPVAPAASGQEPEESQIARYLDLLHNRATAHGVGHSRRARPEADAASEAPLATASPSGSGARRFSDPTRQVAGGPDHAARSAATRPSAPIEGLTPEMIFPRQQEAPAQESMAASAAPVPDVPGTGTDEGEAVTKEGKVRGWFARRQQGRPEPEEATEVKGKDLVGPGKAAPVQRSYQMKRTLEARRVMLETGLPPVTDVPEAIEWLRSGDRARAIAVYRKTVGVGLVEAIDALDALGGDY